MYIDKICISCGYAWLEGRALRLEKARVTSTAARTYLGSCCLENCTFWKLPLEKLPVGRCRLGRCRLGKYPWEGVTWENILGKMLLGKIPLGRCRLGKKPLEKYLTSYFKYALEYNFRVVKSIESCIYIHKVVILAFLSVCFYVD